jgi:quinoprotein relay system zinc metallohydrolase 2
MPHSAPAVYFQALILSVLATFALCATAPAGAAQPLKVEEIAPGVFVHQGRYQVFAPGNSGDTSNSGFVIGRDGVAVIDTGGSPRVGEALLAAVRARTKLPIKYVINTHMHPDHVFGNVAFEGEHAVFVGHYKLPRALAARAEHYLAVNKQLLGGTAFEGTRIIPPTLLVKDRTELDLGGRKLLLEAHATAHTDNDLTVFDEKTSTLFLGDLLFSHHIPALDGSIRGWLAFLDDLEKRTDVALVVPGHGPAAMKLPQALEPEKRYLSTIAGEVRAKIKAGETLSDAMNTVGLSEKDAWRLFKEYNARNVSAAFAELEWE